MCTIWDKVKFHDFTKEVSKKYRRLEKEITANSSGIYPTADYKKHYENAKREFKRKWSLFGR